MPDHVHILARTPEGVDFLSFVNYFKQISAVTLRLLVNNGGAAWQPRFYDHALRSDEGVWAAVSYIFANPVRAGLAEAPGQYPFSGSLEWPDILTAGLDSPVLHSEVILER
jgi:REP element-mobilizing transposase RayT